MVIGREKMESGLCGKFAPFHSAADQTVEKKTTITHLTCLNLPPSVFTCHSRCMKTVDPETDKKIAKLCKMPELNSPIWYTMT